MTFAQRRPPAAAAAGGGRVRALPRGRRLDAAAGAARGRRGRVGAALAPGDRIVLYTDGLVERRREPIDESLERLRSAAEGFDGTLEALCDHLIEALRPPAGARAGRHRRHRARAARGQPQPPELGVGEPLVAPGAQVLGRVRRDLQQRAGRGGGPPRGWRAAPRSRGRPRAAGRGCAGGRRPRRCGRGGRATAAAGWGPPRSGRRRPRRAGARACGRARRRRSRSGRPRGSWPPSRRRRRRRAAGPSAGRSRRRRAGWRGRRRGRCR